MGALLLSEGVGRKWNLPLLSLFLWPPGAARGPEQWAT